MTGTCPAHQAPSLPMPPLHVPTALSGQPDLRRIGKGPEVRNLTPGIRALSLLVSEGSCLPQTPPNAQRV